MAKLEAGEKAPGFRLPHQDARTVSLEDFAGRRVADGHAAKVLAEVSA